MVFYGYLDLMLHLLTTFVPAKKPGLIDNDDITSLAATSHEYYI